MDSSFVVMPGVVLQSLCDTALYGILQARAQDDDALLTLFSKNTQIGAVTKTEMIRYLTQTSSVEGARFVVKYGQSFPSHAMELLLQRVTSIRSLCSLAWDGNVRLHRDDAQALADCGVSLSVRQTASDNRGYQGCLDGMRS